MAVAQQSLQSGCAYQSVAEFYAGKSVFITGGTGFLGKALIEKLLYSCKGIDKIFILIREIKGVSAEERLKQMVSKPIFSRIVRDRPEDLKKLIPVVGDITQPDLGLSYHYEALLTEKVSVVFHVAATIKFNEKLASAVNTNLKGTEYVLNLCHRVKILKAFVHVSTAYTNTDQKILEEKIYPPRVRLDEVLKYIEQEDQDEQYIKKHFLKGLPNTYTFTKGLAENYIETHRGNLPTIIIRPAIVSPALREPIPGWTDNWNGANGLAIASVKGANRIVLGHEDNYMDVIPVDFVSNVTIAAPTRCYSSNSLKVFNSCTSSCNPVSISKFVEGVKNSAIYNGFDVNPSQHLMFTKSRCMLFLVTFLLQIAPSYIADLALRIMRKEPKYVKLQSRVLMGRDLLSYFTSHSWEMRTDNVKALHASLSECDKNKFPCDPSHMSWAKYTAVFLSGVKKYLMNDKF